jgi:hypothetical protein
MSVRAPAPAVAAVAVAALCLSMAGPAYAAEPKAPPPPAAVKRDLPPGTSEAQVRRYCTRKFEDEAYTIPDKAGGAGGMLTNRLFAEFQACLRRNGVRP